MPITMSSTDRASFVAQKQIAISTMNMNRPSGFSRAEDQQQSTTNSSTKLSISPAGQSAADAVSNNASVSAAAPAAGDAISNYFKTTVENRPSLTQRYSGSVTADSAISLGIADLRRSSNTRAMWTQAATREAISKTAPSTIRDVDSFQSPSRQMSANIYAANAQPQQPVLSLLA